MKALIATLALSTAALAGPAMAQDDVMAGWYGNTLAIDIGGQWKGKMFVNPDKTYAMEGDSGPTSGSWAVKGKEFCFTQVKPEADTPSCSTFAKTYAVGDKWENTDTKGNMASLELVKGR